MTAKEAIGIIELAKARVEWDYPLDYTIAFEKAIEALEKQIPMKPGVSQIEGSTSVEFVCRSCGNALGFAWGLPINAPPDKDFCSSCGQAIDWSEVSE